VSDPGPRSKAGRTNTRTSGARGRRPAALVALDGGGSKVDAALVSASGGILGAAHWSHGAEAADAPWLDESLDGDEQRHVLAASAAVRAACLDAGVSPDTRPVAALGVYCLAGADLPADQRRLARAVGRQGWTREDVVRNDTFAVLRAGSDRGWGIAVVCGHGMNCSGVAPNGRTTRFPAKGELSGDWGGGMDLGRGAVWHAVRADDGRGEPTELARVIPAHFGMRRTQQVVEAVHLGRLPERRFGELAPVVFSMAAGGDRVARALLERQADEVVAMAGAAVRKLQLAQLDVDVVLGGGVFRNEDEPFIDRIRGGIHAVAPRARITILSSPPVVGAALLGLDRIGASTRAAALVRRELTHRRLAGRAGGSGRVDTERGVRS
jgi:N-acetylglucosamine kinase-like BadF-type ATPase